jgi:Holliday junction resolvase
VTALEKGVQREVTSLFEGLGCTVYRLGGANRRTTTAAGLPDLYVFCLRKRCGFWFEVKAEWGRLRPEQQTFRDLCSTCGIVHAVGGMREARELCKSLGIMAAA